MSYDYLWYIGSIKNCIIGVADGYKGYWERITERNGLEEHRARCRDGFRACDISSFLVLLHFFSNFHHRLGRLARDHGRFYMAPVGHACICRL